jgi:hypothetical protein
MAHVTGIAVGLDAAGERYALVQLEGGWSP